MALSMPEKQEQAVGSAQHAHCTLCSVLEVLPVKSCLLVREGLSTRVVHVQGAGVQVGSVRHTEPCAFTVLASLLISVSAAGG